MAEINYEVLVSELIKPLVTHPESVNVTTQSVEGNKTSVKVLVHNDDLGRVIGKKGRVASAIRTLVHAAAMRNNEIIYVEFAGEEVAE